MMIFNASLHSRTPFTIHMTLPTTQYELLDAIEQIHGDSSRTDVSLESIEVSRSFPALDYLPNILPKSVDLYDLNHLASKLKTMSQWELDCFVGLTMMDTIKTGYAPISVERLINMTASVDNCQLLYGITNDELLGRFYVENGMTEILEDFPENLYEFLDYETVGKKAKLDDNGAFTPKGYVIMSDEISQAYNSGDAVKKRLPDYTIRLQVSNKEHPDITVHLDLPASNVQLYQAVKDVGADSIEGCKFSEDDCILPSLYLQVNDALKGESYAEINELAENLLVLREDGKIPTYKAMLQSLEPNIQTTGQSISFGTALSLSTMVNQFKLRHDIATPADYAKEKLSQNATLPGSIRPYIDLTGYGEALMRMDNAVRTEYGALVPNAEQSEQQDWEETAGMQMQ